MRWALRIAAILIAVVAIGAGGAWFWLARSLPQTEGTIALVGPQAEIEIVRDRHGIPHIFAQNERDAWFAVGFVHAQDRLWQMEMNRRIGAGRLSEVLGEAAVGFDRFLRTLGVYRYAKATYDNLDETTQGALDAYAAGVNAFLEQRNGPLPPEFLIFGHQPEPWVPADSLVWIKMMAWDLAGNWGEEILRARMATELPAAQIAELFPSYPADGVVALERYASLYRSLPLDEVAAAIGPLAPTRHNGSNNWVVAGTRSATGKPLLANDPHLGLAIPALWYFVHVEAPGLSVIGATLPGMPVVILGRTDRVAWGFTNTGSDVQDLYVERLDPEDPGRYLTPEGSAPFETREEVIRVRGQDDIALTVRSTRHGPVISDVHPGAAAVTGEGHVLALAWPTLRADDLTAQAGLMINKAQSEADVLDAMRLFHSPQQNIVYADADGNIGFYAPARVPVRQPGHSGNEPVPGWTGDFDWTGFIPFEDLPHTFNPEAGAIATANNRIVSEDYPYYLTYDWAVPYRAERIAELLDARRHHSLESFKDIQADIVSGAARDFLPVLLRAEPASEVAAEAIALLSRWDYVMDRNRPEPLIYAAWYRELTRLVMADELGALFDDYWGLRPRFMRTVLKEGRGHWCDDVASAATETCDDLSAAALERALAFLSERHGEDMARWRWGDAHVARSEHRPFHGQPVVGDLFETALPNDGDSFTVNAAHHRITDAEFPFRQHHGPSLRAIYDLEDPDRSLFIHSTGQSGNRLSRLYTSFAERWRNVEYVPMTTRRADIEAGAIGRLVLQPAR